MPSIKKDQKYIADLVTESEPCFICAEAEEGKFSEYAHPKAQKEAHRLANLVAEEKAVHSHTEEYIDYYMLFYRIEYVKIYTTLLDQLREEYYKTLLEKSGQCCQYHNESQLYHTMAECPECQALFNPIAPCPECAECESREGP